MKTNKVLTTRQVVEKLRNKGYKIEYKSRKDGGILITSINGSKYSAAEGNKVARDLTGDYLSKKQTRQRKKITTKRVEAYKGLDKETVKLLRKTQRIWRENKDNLKIPSRSRVTARQLRYNIKQYGLKKAKKLLLETQKYAQGYAYTENVNLLITRLERSLKIAKKIKKKLTNAENTSDIILYLKSNIDTIKEDQLERIINVEYTKGNNQQSAAESANQIRKILGIPLKGE